MNSELKLLIERTIPHLDGWCSIEKAIALGDVILAIKPAVVVEIGVFGGRSLLPMAMALREAGGGMAYGIDPWRVADAIDGDVGEANKQWWTKSVDLHRVHLRCIEAIWNNGVQDFCTIIRAPSQNCATRFPTIDLLHIDGCHSELASCRDVDIYVPRVRPGGHVFFDDSDWETTQKAVGILKATLKQEQGVGPCLHFTKAPPTPQP